MPESYNNGTDWGESGHQMEINQKPTAIASYTQFKEDGGKENWHERIMEIFRTQHIGGATDAEIMKITGKPRNEVAARRRELEIMGLLMIVGQKQDAHSKRMVNIYAINPAPRPLVNFSPSSKITAIRKLLKDFDRSGPAEAYGTRAFYLIDKLDKILKDE